MLNPIKRALAKDVVKSAMRHGGVDIWYNHKANDLYLAVLYQDGCYEEVEAVWDPDLKCWCEHSHCEEQNQIVTTGWSTCGQLKVG